MSASYFGFTFSNTNSNSRQRSCVRVYKEGEGLIHTQYINKHSPLGYVREHPGSKHRAEIKAACLSHGMSEQEFESVMWLFALS